MTLVTFHIPLMKKPHTGDRSVRNAHWQRRVGTLNCLPLRKEVDYRINAILTTELLK